MLQLLKQNKDLLVRKRLYLEMGCRGDWPEVRRGGQALGVQGSLLTAAARALRFPIMCVRVLNC